MALLSRFATALPVQLRRSKLTEIHEILLQYQGENRSRNQLTERPLLYTHPDCDYSDLLKQDKDAEGVEYEEIDLGLRPEAWADLEKLTDGERITPVLVESGVVTIGYNGIG